MTEHVYEVWARVGEVEATVECGEVVVSVGACGDVRSLVIDPRVFRSADPAALADDVVHAISAAAAAARRRAFAVMAPLLPAGETAEDADLEFGPLRARPRRMGIA